MVKNKEEVVKYSCNNLKTGKIFKKEDTLFNMTL